MKTFLNLITAITLVLFMSACGSDSGGTTDDGTANSATTDDGGTADNGAGAGNSNPDISNKDFILIYHDINADGISTIEMNSKEEIDYAIEEVTADTKCSDFGFTEDQNFNGTNEIDGYGTLTTYVNKTDWTYCSEYNYKGGIFNGDRHVILSFN